MDNAQPSAPPPTSDKAAAESNSIRWAAISHWAAIEAAEMVAASKKRRQRGLVVSAVFAAVLALMIIFGWSTADTLSRIWLVVMICQTGWFYLTDRRPNMVERRLLGVVLDEANRPENAPAINVLFDHSLLDDDAPTRPEPLKWLTRKRNQQQLLRALESIIKEADDISGQNESHR